MADDRFCTLRWEGRVAHVSYGGRRPLTVDTAALAEPVKDDGLKHGIEQVLRDIAASCSEKRFSRSAERADACERMAHARIAAWNIGQWSAQGRAWAPSFGWAVLEEAICRAFPARAELTRKRMCLPRGETTPRLLTIDEWRSAHDLPKVQAMASAVLQERAAAATGAEHEAEDLFADE